MVTKKGGQGLGHVRQDERPRRVGGERTASRLGVQHGRNHCPPSSNEDSGLQWNEEKGGFVGAGDKDGGGEGRENDRAGMELFLIDEEHRRFKATVVHEPYFYLIPEDEEHQTQDDGEVREGRVK